MVEREASRRSLSWGLGGALGTAFGCAVWALVGHEACGACRGAAEAFGGRTLAGMGIVGYGALLGLWLARAPLAWLSPGIFAAAGIHAGLLAALARSGTWCLPCLGAALGGGAAFVLVLCLEPANLLLASAVLAAGALGTESWALAVGPGLPPARAGEALRGEPPPASDVPEGRVRLVIYSRPDCGFCRELDQEVLPPIARRLGDRLEVVRRPAQSVPGLPTPTLLLLGRGGRKVFSGLPDPEELERALQSLSRGGGHEKTLSSDAR